MGRQEISDEVWSVIEPLLPVAEGAGRPWLEHRAVLEGIVWRFRTGAPWRDVPERFGKWNSIYNRFNCWAKDGTWDRVLAAVHARADADGELAWVTAIDSTITRVHQQSNDQNLWMALGTVT